MTTKLLSAAELADQLGISRRTLWRLASAGRLPQPIKLGPRLTRWRLADVEKALDRIQQRRGPTRGERKV